MLLIVRIHGILMGKVKNDWQERDYVLKWFGKTENEAKVSINELRSGSRRQEVSGIRSLIAIGLVINHGVSLAEVARRVDVSTTAISKIIKRANP